MAVRTLEHADVYLMTEYRISNAFEFEGDFTRAHPLVAVAAVPGNSECSLAVVAGAAGSAFLHLCHGNILILAGDDLAVVTAFAGEAGLRDVRIVAESNVRSTFDFECYGFWLPFVALGAVLFILDAERFNS